jgi:hypothetical protein
MPGIRFYFILVRAFVVAFAGPILALNNQLSGTSTSIALSTWLIAVLAGAVAAVNEGHVSWPKAPVRRKRRRHRYVPSAEGMPPTSPVPLHQRDPHIPDTSL